MAIQKSSTKTALDLGNFESVVDEKLNSIFQRLTKNQTTIDKSISYALSNPGKRIRPTLVFLVGDFLGIETSRLESIAGAIELIHTYSLVHDDLPCMDDDDLRRGKPTLHKKFNESTAVLAGDALQTLAFNLILDDKNLNISEKQDLLSDLAKRIGPEGMVLGQNLDIEYEQKNPTFDEIMKMNRLKTGLLIEFSILSSFYLKGDLTKDWYQLAKNIGISFQLIDDMLDLSETTEKIGKTAKKDLENNKKTIPICFGIDKTMIEVDKFKESTMEICEKLCLNNHPLSAFIDSLFSRKF
ncbi:MAG: polyprenyl synthetase family protein [SAR86 cluster bacterium]|jgi:geranylgeranyl pyrophosphate synthase|nr:MAG: polyprenyl synthetase family protein [SAR86 cluster bacterium]|tara:strand:- start:2750 stop:3643 length:894 start_codon:yes stop_codon:yes gene_type:complete